MAPAAPKRRTFRKIISDWKKKRNAKKFERWRNERMIALVESIKSIQKEINSAGFQPRSVSGSRGPRQSYDYEVDNVADNSGPTPLTRPELEEMKKNLERQLNALKEGKIILPRSQIKKVIKKA